jgi:WD40 repeat protein/tRNA A-37 threonylcarbamoyl transferase component Bud32
VTPCPDEARLEALAEGSLPGAEAGRLWKHLESCPACREIVDDWRENLAILPDVQREWLAGAEADTGIAPSPVAAGAEADHDSSDSFRDSFPGYRIIREIHRGGQGLVYQAVQMATKRRVAIKVMKEGPFASRGERARFEREVEILGQLNHPHIVAIHDSGTAVGRCYFVMDYISGQPLDCWMAAQEHSVDEVLRLFAKICEAVNAAHVRGIIHRDLKPGNICIDGEGEPHVLDFGLAKVAAWTDASLMTMTGQFVGSLPWASPEQAEAAPGRIDMRADVYSLGVILYQMLTGKFPYDVAGNMRDVLDRIVKSEPVRPSTIRKQINDEVETIVLKCLSKERERRYQTAGELGRDIGHYLSGDPIEAKRDSFGYVLRKHLRRYKAPVATGLAFVALLVGSLVLISTLLVGQSELLVRQRQLNSEVAAALGRERVHSEQLQRALYVNQIAAAAAAYRDNAIGRMKQILDETSPNLRGWEWKHLNAVSDVSLATFPGHQGTVLFISLSPGGRQMVSGSSDGTVKCWDPGTRVLLWTRQELQGAVFCASFMPAGWRIASGAVDGTVALWDARKGAPLWTFPGHTRAVYSISFSRDGRRVASGDDDGTVRLWDAETGTKLRTLRGHEGVVCSLSFSSDARRIVSGGGDGTVRLWDTQTGTELWRLRGHNGRVWFVCFSPDGRRIASGSGDKTVKLWDTETGAELRTLHGHGGLVCAISFSPDGRRIISGSQDRTLKLWDAETGAELGSFRGHERMVSAVCFARDDRIVSGSWDQTVKLWDAGTDAEFRVLHGHAGLVRCISFSPDGRRIVSGSANGTLKLWDVETGVLLRTLEGHDGLVCSVSLSPDGKRIASASQDGTLKVWQAQTGALLRTLPGHKGDVWCVAFSPSGQRIVSGGQDGTLKLWATETGAQLHTINTDQGAVYAVSFSPDGQRIVSAGHDGSVKLWNADRGSRLLVLPGHGDGGVANSVSFSPDGRQIASGAWDGQVRVWDARTGAHLQSLQGHEGAVFSVWFSPDGRRIVSGGDDGTVKLWDVESHAEVWTFRGHQDRVCAVSFSPDGRWLASGSSDGTVAVYDSVPYPVRYTRRQAALAAFEAARPLVEDRHRLWGDWSRVVAAIRADRSMDEVLRQQALNLVLMYAAPGAETRSGTPFSTQPASSPSGGRSDS